MYKSKIRRYKIQLLEKDKVIHELLSELIRVKGCEKENFGIALNHIKMLLTLLPQESIKKTPIP
jgi:REP element-mobilizing transposase RayT